jgi:hypothetical protein
MSVYLFVITLRLTHIDMQYSVRYSSSCLNFKSVTLTRNSFSEFCAESTAGPHLRSVYQNTRLTIRANFNFVTVLWSPTLGQNVGMSPTEDPKGGIKVTGKMQVVVLLVVALCTDMVVF